MVYIYIHQNSNLQLSSFHFSEFKVMSLSVLHKVKKSFYVVCLLSFPSILKLPSRKLLKVIGIPISVLTE